MRENLEASFEFIQRDAVQFIDEDEVTNYGLSLSLYKVLTQQPWKTQKDLQKLSKAEALELFTQFYWEPLLCDQLQSGIDYFIFDSAVVYGSALASRWLHGSLGLSPAWPTRPAVIRLANDAIPKVLIGQLANIRRRYCKNHPKWSTMSSLWTNRTTRVVGRSEKLIKGSK